MPRDLRYWRSSSAVFPKAVIRRTGSARLDCGTAFERNLLERPKKRIGVLQKDARIYLEGSTYPCPTRVAPTAVPQLMCPGAVAIKWIFCQEKSTLHRD